MDQIAQMIVQTLQDPFIVFFGEAFIKLKLRAFDSEFVALHTDIKKKVYKEIQIKRECF